MKSSSFFIFVFLVFDIYLFLYSSSFFYSIDQSGAGMYKVKITTNNSNSILRQTKHGKGISHCGKYIFYIDEPVDDPDFWVVRNKSLKKPTSCVVAPENTILMVSEPLTVVNYPKHYRDQFGLYHTCQDGAKHRNMLLGPAALPWYIGGLKSNGDHVFNYDLLKQSPLPKKTKLISVITSNKVFTKGHQDRLDFVLKLKAYYGDQLDVFGRGFKPFDDKWDILAPYKYHIAIENSSFKYYWTEKIADCYLSGTFPIYYGCSNISDYFPKEGYESINIQDFEKAVKQIDQLIEQDAYSKRVDALVQCKDLVLDEYDFFALVAKCCDRLDPKAPKSVVRLKPAKTVFDLHNFYLYFFKRNFFVLKGWFRKKMGYYTVLNSR